MFTLTTFNKRFRKLTFSDIEWIQDLIKADGNTGCQYSFACMYLWQDIFETVYCQHKNCLIRKSEESKTHITYHYPIGDKKDRKEAARSLIKKAFLAHKTIHFYGLSDETLAELKEISQEGNMNYELVRDNQNYILLSDNIINLEGSKYSKHKRYLARFKENTNWSWESITQDNVADCIKFNENWYSYQEKSITKEQELTVTDKALKLMSELKLSGCVLKLDGEIIAFEIGEPITQNMFASHFQKARRDIVGSYQMIYHVFAEAFCTNYTYLNIEEDMGEPGLRNAKLSWKPEFLTNYYIAQLSSK